MQPRRVRTLRQIPMVLVVVGLGGMLSLLAVAAVVSQPTASCPRELGVIPCGGQCADATVDPHNCGICGNSCAPGLLCRAGICRFNDLPSKPPRKPDPGTWSQRSPLLGGRLASVAAQSTDANALAVSSPGGGAWFTINNGGAWSQPYVSTQGVVSYLADFTDVHFEWDRLNSSSLYLETWSDLYLTTNFGQTWTNLTGNGGDPAPLMPETMAVNFTDPRPFTQLVLNGTTRIVLAALPCEGLLYSYNGTTFTQTWPFGGGSSNPDNCLQWIAADDPTGYVYFSTFAEPGSTTPSHVYASSCAWTPTTPCLTWTNANNGLPNGLSLSGLVDTADCGVGLTCPENLVALVTPASGTASVYETFNGGATWPFSYSLPVPSNEPTNLEYPGQNYLFAGTQVAFESPNSYGSSWKQISNTNGVFDHPDFRAFSWDSSYLWGSTDGDDSNLSRWNWSLGTDPSNETSISVTGTNGLPVWMVYDMAVVPRTNFSGRHVFLLTQDNGAACSDDDGTTWMSLGAPPLPTGDIISLAAAPSAGGVAYATGNNVTPVHTTNVDAEYCSSIAWSNCGATVYPPTIWNHHSMALHPLNANDVYFAQENHTVAVSQDGCQTVTQYTLPNGADPISLFVDSSGNIYAGTYKSGAYLSTNGGVTWSPWALNASPPTAVMAIAWTSAPSAPGTFYLATTSGLFQLLPGGSWTLVAGGDGYTVSDVAVDPNCSVKIYAALGYVFSLGRHRGGVLFSDDNGSTWNSITAGLAIHQSPVASIQVDPLSTEYLWAGSYGLGGWLYDSGSTSCP